MLNCTNLECILHHHQYFAHLHHLKHGTHVEEDEDALSTESGQYNDDSVQGLLNGTGDSELSGLSHLDAPNESLYMIGGVCVAMVMVGVIIVLLAVTISKLRKREEHSNSVHPVVADVVLHQPPTAPVALHPPQAMVANITTGNIVTDPVPYRGQFLWQYPPSQPPTFPPIYNSKDQDSIGQNLPTERGAGFVRGFRKNLGGRWRRLVKRKPVNEAYTIPAELKPQLKQIYVY